MRQLVLLYLDKNVRISVLHLAGKVIESADALLPRFRKCLTQWELTKHGKWGEYPHTPRLVDAAVMQHGVHRPPFEDIADKIAWTRSQRRRAQAAGWVERGKKRECVGYTTSGPEMGWKVCCDLPRKRTPVRVSDATHNLLVSCLPFVHT